MFFSIYVNLNINFSNLLGFLLFCLKKNVIGISFQYKTILQVPTYSST